MGHDSTTPGSGRARNFAKSHGSDRVGSDRVGSEEIFALPRVVRIGWVNPLPDRIRSDPGGLTLPVNGPVFQFIFILCGTLEGFWVLGFGMGRVGGHQPLVPFGAGGWDGVAWAGENHKVKVLPPPPAAVHLHGKGGVFSCGCRLCIYAARPRGDATLRRGAIAVGHHENARAGGGGAGYLVYR